MKETVVLQYLAWQACNKLHFGDIRKEEIEARTTAFAELR